MRKLFNSKRFLAGLAGAIVLSFALLACTVGLGESVDTQAPVVNITYPPANAVVRDTFVLAGTWDDDKLISSISVSLMDTNDKDKVIPFSGTVKILEDKTWSVEVNKRLKIDTDEKKYDEWELADGGFELADGTYQISISAKDAAGHTSGVNTRTFIIDNTPPIFVISSPGITLSQTQEGGTPKAYGTALKISGKLADSNGVNYSKLEVYDKNGESLLDSLYSDYVIEKGDDSSVILSRKIKGMETTYDLIYDKSSDTGDIRYFTGKLTLSDEARPYKNPYENDETVEKKTGNITTDIWLNDDVASLFQSSGKGLSISELTKIKNGSYIPGETGSLTAEDLQEVRDILRLNVTDNALKENYLSFSLNPKAAPSYTVNNMKIGGWTEDSFGKQIYTKSQNVTVVVSPAGISQPPNINPKTFKVWLYKLTYLTESEATGALANINSIYGDVSKTEKERIDSLKEKHWMLIHDNSETYTGASCDSDYNMPFNLNAAIESGAYYLVVATGEDVDGSQMTGVNSENTFGYYGFKGGDGLPPTIDSNGTYFFNTNTNERIKKSGYAATSEHIGINIQATADSEISKTQFTVTVNDLDSNNDDPVGIVKYTKDFETFPTELNKDPENPHATGTMAVSLSEIINNGTLDAAGYTKDDLKAALKSGRNYSYQFDYIVIDKQQMTSKDNGTVNVDSKSPVFDIKSVSPTIPVYDSEGATITGVKLNGTVTLNGSVRETHLKNITYEYWVKRPGEAEWSKIPALSGSMDKTTISLPLYTAMATSATTVSLDNTLVRLKLVATDTVGNQSVYWTTEYNDDEDSNIKTVYDSGDVDSVPAAAAGKTIVDFSIDQNSDKPSVSLKAGSQDATDKDKIPEENVFTKDDSLKIDFTDDDGLDEILIRVFDASGTKVDEQTFNGNRKASKTVNYALSNFTNEGIYKVVISAKDTEYNNAEADADFGNNLVKDITITDAQKAAIISKIQANRIVAPDPFYIAIDNAAPAITEVITRNAAGAYVSGVGSDGLTTNAVFSLAGTVTESNGIKSIVITDTVTGKTYTVSGITEGDKVSAKAWSYAFKTGISNKDDTDYINDGTHTFTITANDIVGKKTTLTRTVIVDTTKPSIISKDGMNGFVEAGVNLGTAQSPVYWYSKNTLSFEGNASDGAGTGIKSVWYSTSTTAEDNTETWSDYTKFTGTTDWFGSVSNLVSSQEKTSAASPKSKGTKVKIKVIDNAGNESVSSAYGPWNIDMNEPAVDSESVKTRLGTTAVFTTGKEVLSNKKDVIQIIFNVKDDGGSGLNENKVYISTSKTLVTDLSNGIKATKVTSEDSSKGIEFKDGYTLFMAEIPKASIANGAVYAFAYDKAQNSVRESLCTLSVDETAPTVVLNIPSDADVDTADVTDVNKVISLTGTGKDETKFKKIVRLEYNTSSATATTWTALTTSNAGAGYTLDGSANFTASGIDTTKFTDKKNIYVRAVGEDDADNIGYSNVITLYVNQASDRPRVMINNLTPNGSSYILKYGTNAQVTGTITDDDAVNTKKITKLIVSESAYTGTGTEPDNLATITDATGDFTIQPSDTSDGSKTFYIYIEDNAGGKFYTTATTASNMANPKLYIKGNAASEDVNKTVFSYSSDGTNPIAKLGEGLPYATTTSAVAKDDSGNDYAISTDSKPTTNATLNSSFKAGGSARKFVKFYFTANDASGIEGMTLEIKDENGNTVVRRTTAAKIGDVTIDSAYTVDKNGFTSTSNGSADAKWLTDHIDFSSVLTGQCTVALTPYDKAGLTGNGAFSFYVDNDGPVIENIKPVAASEVTGSVEITGNANDKGTAGTVNVQWRIPTATEVTTAKNKGTDAARKEYLKGLKWSGGVTSLAADATVNSWQFNFDGGYDAASSTPVSSSKTEYIYNAGNPDLTEFDNSTFAQNTDYGTTGAYSLPVYFMATDNLGNYTIYEGYTISHNPDADKPKVEFTYPTKDDYDEIKSGDTVTGHQDYVTLGGTIRVTGSAIIPSGTTTVKEVYYQISGESKAFNTADKTKAGTGSGNYGYTVVDAYTAINDVVGATYSSSNPPADPKVYGFATKADMDAWWGIKATGTAAWNVVLNSRNELNPSTAGTTNNITLRACGINAEGKVGVWTSGDNIIAIHIDDTAPTITASVDQFDSGVSVINAVPTTAPTASQTYESDMYLKGNWVLTLELLDETAVTGVIVKKGNSVLEEGTGYFKDDVTYGTEGEEGYKKGYKVYIPVSRAASSVEYTVNAQDSNHVASQSFSFNIDEVAPTLENLTIGGEAYNKDAIHTIENNNYVFNIGGKAMDEGSGVERVVFYYMRKSGVTKTTVTNQVVMDPLITTGTDDAKVALSSLEARNFTQGKTTYTLYAKAYSGTATTDAFTTTGTYDAHVRVGGLIEIDGVLRKITKISGQEVEFTPSLSNEKTTSFTAYFPVAQVIDNTATEKTSSDSANPFEFEKGDDGDLMPESFSKSGKTWTWDASIHSDNMSDGPVSLVILAFDNAGNVNGVTVKGNITNNAPRLAKVWLGTDLSGDGKYANSASLEEIVEYDILGAEGKEQSSYTLDFTETDKYAAGTFTIKNGLVVMPEFTGGNGTIGMVASTSATSAAAVTGSVTAATEKAAITKGTTTRTFSGSKVNGTFTASNTTNSVYAFIPSTLPADGTNKGMSFTFWDSTEETTQGSDSQNSVLYVKNFTVAQTDSVKPTVVINPFWWNKADDNSLCGNSTANGHIELERDWITVSSYDGKASGTYLDADPKVSGKIRFTGTAYDNVRLKSIAITFSNITGSAVATYDTKTSSWTVPATTLADNGYVFSVSDVTKDVKGNAVGYGNYEDTVYFGQKGHKIYWTLDIDTAKITNAAAKDIQLKVIATDAAGKTTDVSTGSNLTADKTARIDVVDGTTNVSTYRVDVVPYVTGLNTTLCNIEKKNPSIYGRSALGKYPVYAYSKNGAGTSKYEDIGIKGFNLTGGTVTFAGTSDNTASISDSKFSIPTGAVSGKITVTVNGVVSLNNINANDAKGSSDVEELNADNFSKYAYNRQPNNMNNELLTDDIELAIWDINSRAAMGNSGDLTEVDMHVNPLNGLVGVAFGHSAAYASFPNGKTNSYENWAFGWTSVNTIEFAYDQQGYAHGTNAGTDTATSDNKASRFRYTFTKWGKNSDLKTQKDWQTCYGKVNALRLEYMAEQNPFVSKERRFPNPKIATSIIDTDADGDVQDETTTNVYLMYYDSILNEIKFKAGALDNSASFDPNGGTTSATDLWKSANTNFGDFKDTAINGSTNYGTNYTYVSVVANASTTTAGVGEHYDIAVVPGTKDTTDTVVAVWYDEDAATLWYSYIEDPIGNRRSNIDSTTHVNSSWHAPVKILDGNAAGYCAIAVDEDGHIHIGSAAKGKVMYTYLNNYKSSYDADKNTCVVDAYGSPGWYLTMDIAKDSNGRTIPYIGYYSVAAQYPRYAYLVDTSSADSTNAAWGTANWLPKSGSDDMNEYTQAWESIILPTQSSINLDDINIGVWKYQTADATNKIVKGQIRAIPTQDASTNSGASGKVGGNGSLNPILGYGISYHGTGYVETAQMK